MDLSRPYIADGGACAVLSSVKAGASSRADAEIGAVVDCGYPSTLSVVVDRRLTGELSRKNAGALLTRPMRRG